jgi:hypothetical protein
MSKKKLKPLSKVLKEHEAENPNLVFFEPRLSGLIMLESIGVCDDCLKKLAAPRFKEKWSPGQLCEKCKKVFVKKVVKPMRKKGIDYWS